MEVLNEVQQSFKYLIDDIFTNRN